MLAIMIGIPLGLLIAFWYSKMIDLETEQEKRIANRGVTVKVYDEAQIEELKNRCLKLGSKIAEQREEMVLKHLASELRYCVRCGQKMYLSRFHSVRECDRCRRS